MTICPFLEVTVIGWSGVGMSEVKESAALWSCLRNAVSGFSMAARVSSRKSLCIVSTSYLMSSHEVQFDSSQYPRSMHSLRSSWVICPGTNTIRLSYWVSPSIAKSAWTLCSSWSSTRTTSVISWTFSLVNGGSAWGYFIDGDRRGTCCESDHNRNDGYTFIHIKHDQNREYLIDVVVFDKLNTGSSNYNGPYTITMTDITGTDKLASNLYLGTRTKAPTTVSTNRQYAVSFTTGQNPGGYKLDRIRTHITGPPSSPELALHVGTSSAPGAKSCDFRNPTRVQHHLPPADNPAPVPFLAPACADVTIPANSTYWIVFAGRSYKPVVTDTNDQLTNRSGWFIGNRAVTKTTGAWSNLTETKTIAVQIWASRR